MHNERLLLWSPFDFENLAHCARIKRIRAKSIHSFSWKNNQCYYWNKITINIWYSTAKEITKCSKSNCPKRSANYVVSKERGIMHMPNTGKNWRKCAHNRHEAGENNCFLAIFRVKILCALKMVFMENY